MRVVKNKILIFISFLDRKLALFVSKMVRRSSNSERVLLIPAASIDGGFGDGKGIFEPVPLSSDHL